MFGLRERAEGTVGHDFQDTPPRLQQHLFSSGAGPVLTVQVGKLRLRGTCPHLPGSNLGPSLRQGLRSLISG